MSHQRLECYQGNRTLDLEHETFQRPKTQRNHLPNTSNSITHALIKFGTPCTGAQKAPTAMPDTLLPHCGAELSTIFAHEDQANVNDPSTDQLSNWKGHTHHSELSQCMLQRMVVGKVPYTNGSRAVQDSLEGHSPVQEVESQLDANTSIVYSCQDSQDPNPSGAPLILTTSQVGPGVLQTSLHAQPAPQSDDEAAEVRYSTKSLLGKTTLVVRNIPARYTQQDILKRFWVPDGTFDLLFLPYSFKLGRTVGYGFINFTSPAYAQAFYRQWQGQMLAGGSKAKPLDIHASRSQGIYDNMKHLSTSDVMRVKNTKYQPSVFHGMRSISFMDALQAFGLAGSAKHTARQYQHSATERSEFLWQ